jgi:TRAP-type uncharacterized transport system fused permease subunit
MIATLFILAVITLTILMCWQESKHRKIHFLFALLLCIVLTPFIACYIITGRPMRRPIGCPYCGNEFNEAKYCGLCGKNENGERKT